MSETNGDGRAARLVHQEVENVEQGREQLLGDGLQLRGRRLLHRAWHEQAKSTHPPRQTDTREAVEE